MAGIQNFNGVSFGSSYVIPFNQIKNSQTMRNIGDETAKYVQNPNDMAPHPNGIIVKVDDAKDKEYEAVIAKYGVNIQKYHGDFKPQDMELRAYDFMVSKLDPKHAKQKIEEFKTLDATQKHKVYLETYKDFKTSKYSVENQANATPVKFKPTNAPIIKIPTKNGETIIAREVQFENGYTCVAVADEKNPSKTILMNKDEFGLFVASYAIQK